VEPWRLLAHGGGWYVVGRDRDRDAPRSFRLSRIEGAVRQTGEPGSYEIPADLDAAVVLSGGESESTRLATLALAPERASALRSRAVVRDGNGPDAADPAGLEAGAARLLAHRDLVRVPFTGTAELADEVAGYADAVVVLAPPDLRAAVLRRLRAAAALDAPGAGGPHG